MTKNIILFGYSGLLGKSFIKFYSKKIKVYSPIHKKKNNQRKINFIKKLSMKNLEKFIINNKINAIFNFAGLTNIENCEKNKMKSKKANFDLPISLAKVARNTNIQYVFISTDNFLSSKNKIKENTKVKPLNIYAKHKLNSENKIKKLYSKSLIIRTNFFCSGSFPRYSFSDVILMHLKKNKKLFLFRDVFFTPIYSFYLFKFIFILIENKCKGIYNVVSNEKISKFDFGLQIAKIFNLKSHLINISYLKNRKDLVKRPFNMALDNKKLKNKIKLKIPTIKQQLIKLKKDMKKKC